MFSHILVCWLDPNIPNATEQFIAGAEKFLRPIPGMVFFHAGQCVPSEHPVVDSSFQVTLNMVFESKQAFEQYVPHPNHVEFAEAVFKKLAVRAIIYDAE